MIAFYSNVSRGEDLFGYPIRKADMENIIVEHMDTTEGQEKVHPEYFENRKALKQTKYEPKHA